METCTSTHCQAKSATSTGLTTTFKLPCAYLTKVDPNWLEHLQLKQSGHLTADLALHLKRIISLEEPNQPELRKDLEAHHMDAGLLYLLWSLLPERVLVLPSVNCTWLSASPSTEEELQ